MTSAIAISNQAPATVYAAASLKAKEVNKGGASKPAEAEVKTTVTISQAAVAALAAQKEALETPAQTAQEARGNDRQAQRLVARQAALKTTNG